MAGTTADQSVTEGLGGDIALGIRKKDNTFQFLNHDSNIDSSGKESFKTVFGEDPIVEKTPTTLVNVVYGKGTAKIIEIVANGGTITADESMLIATSSTATNGSARVESEHAVRYTPGEEFYSYFTALFTTGVIGADQLCGPCSETDGFAVGFIGEDFSIVYRNDSVDINIPQSQFNRDKLDGTGLSGFTLDPTMLNQFRITFGWLGSSNIFFQIYTATKGWIFFHEIEIAGTLAVPHIIVPYLPMILDVTKTSGDTDIVCKSGSWNSGVMGKSTIGVSDFLHSESIPQTALTGGVETHLISFRGLATLNGIINRIEALMLHWTVAADGTKPTIFKMYRDSILTGGSWSDHETGASVLEINTTATIDTLGEEILSTTTARQGSKDLNIEHLRIDIHKGNIITVTGESANNTDIINGNNWREEF